MFCRIWHFFWSQEEWSPFYFSLPVVAPWYTTALCHCVTVEFRWKLARICYILPVCKALFRPVVVHAGMRDVNGRKTTEGQGSIGNGIIGAGEEVKCEIFSMQHAGKPAFLKGGTMPR